MNVHLVDGPAVDYKEINLHVLTVEIGGGAGWVTLGNPDATIDLLKLTGGVAATLAAGAPIPPGSYSQMRLVLGSGNTVKLADDSVHDLTVPSGLQSGLKILVHFDVAPGTVRDVFIDFEAKRSIFLHSAGASGKYILRPVIRATDRLVSGAIRGVLSGTQGELVAPLAGVEVTAQVVAASGAASVVRTAHTDAAGHYALDLLPLGETYFVVSQPVAGGVVYLAKASGPLPLTPDLPDQTYDATFDEAAGSGGAAGAISPPATADDADTVEARQVLGGQAFVVRTAGGVVAGGGETYAIADLPAGIYSLSATRRTLDAGGGETATIGAAFPAEVMPGATAQVDLTVP
jgi:hypothetical protein